MRIEALPETYEINSSADFICKLHTPSYMVIAVSISTYTSVS